mmetsp:Transcript_7630/g.30616  ORF Transcript_7630/g.30616 Transcript_7630/m.30616 type:complete len:220 (-) Transcript_7630:202-861(-)
MRSETVTTGRFTTRAPDSMYAATHRTATRKTKLAMTLARRRSGVASSSSSATRALNQRPAPTTTLLSNPSSPPPSPFSASKTYAIKFSVVSASSLAFSRVAHPAARGNSTKSAASRLSAPTPTSCAYTVAIPRPSRAAPFISTPRTPHVVAASLVVVSPPLFSRAPTFSTNAANVLGIGSHAITTSLLAANHSALNPTFAPTSITTPALFDASAIAAHP